MLYLYKCRYIYQDGGSSEGKQECITNNDGTKSIYKQGVNKYSNGALAEGSWIDYLWNGKVNRKWENGDRQISENLNDEKHGPSIVYDFDGKVIKGYFSNGEEIFLQ